MDLWVAIAVAVLAVLAVVVVLAELRRRRRRYAVKRRMRLEIEPDGQLLMYDDERHLDAVLDDLKDLTAEEPAPPAPAPPPASAPPPPAPAPEPAPPAARFANVKLRDPRGSPDPFLAPGEHLVVEVDIGPLARESDVVRPVPFPDEMLPDEDVWLDVLLASADFHVALDVAGLDRAASAAEDRLRLPRDGGRARTAAGGEILRFVMRPIAESPAARARLSYLYRNTVVQSQRIDLQVAFGHPAEAEVTTDFTLSQRLGRDLDAVPARPRVTVITNESGMHEITVRAADVSGTHLTEPQAFAIRHDAIGPRVEELRETLDAIAPRERARPKAHLVRDLQRLAPLGWKLYTTLSAPVQDAVRRAEAVEDAVIQIVLPLDSTFTIPWAFVYDIYLDTDVHPERLPVCPVVSGWDGSSALAPAGVRRCPHEADVDHSENLLCPFGFWGYRHSVEVITSTDRPKPVLRFPEASRVVVAETRRGVDRRQLADHVRELGGIFARRVPGTLVTEADSKAAVRVAVEDDIPVVYFLCHGYRDHDGTTLGVGQDERISPSDINGWVDVALRRRGWRMWSDPQPLVFINACESLAIAPDDLVDYVGAFVGKANAVGVIGTEVKVSQTLAMSAAEAFFGSLVGAGATVDEALRGMRGDFLAAGNLFGLVYTPYCFADLRIGA